LELTGPYVSGRPGERFVYLSWGQLGDDASFTMFRRAKLWLNAVPPEVLADAVAAGVLVGRLGLRDPKGNPVCASIRPPLIEWSVGPA
jgi:hypothetical protein